MTPRLKAAPQDEEPVRRQLEHALESAEFAQAELMRRFLRYVVERALAGDAEMLTGGAERGAAAAGEASGVYP